MLLAGNRSQVLKTTPPRKQHRSSRSAKHHQRLAVVLRAYTQLAQQAIRHSQLEACRQGSLFLAPPHLLQGLLDTEGCRACELLNAAGLSAAAAEAVLVDPTMVPTSSSLSAGDLYFAPDAQKALRMAADASQAAGVYVYMCVKQLQPASKIMGHGCVCHMSRSQQDRSARPTPNTPLPPSCARGFTYGAQANKQQALLIFCWDCWTVAMLPSTRPWIERV